jgi:hypothetical protein
MNIESFNKVTFLYDTGPIPPPFCYRYNITISSEDAENFEITADLDYYDRNEVSEDEIYNEGFSPDDNFQWKGSLPTVWIQEIIGKLNTSNWKKQISIRPGDTGLILKLESEQGAEDLEPADLRTWEVFIQEIIQACFELSGKEAPLYICYLENYSKNGKKQFKITYSFAHRSVILKTSQEYEKDISWPEGRKLLKYIFGIDYLPEEGLAKIPAEKGSYICPGEDLWYRLDSEKKVKDAESKVDKLVSLLRGYLD